MNSSEMDMGFIGPHYLTDRSFVSILLKKDDVFIPLFIYRRFGGGRSARGDGEGSAGPTVLR